MIEHFKDCRYDYPEKPEGETPQHVEVIEIEDGLEVHTCTDCGAHEIKKKEGHTGDFAKDIEREFFVSDRGPTQGLAASDPEMEPERGAIADWLDSFRWKLQHEIADFYDAMGIIGTTLIIAAVAGVCLVVWMAVHSGSWEEYSKTNNCVSTGETRVATDTSWIPVGKTTIISTTQHIETKYRCDYWH